MDVYVLNPDLELIGLIDHYTSLIWVNRYKEVGECELYIEATSENLDLLQKGNYLTRNNDEMVCRIESIEIDTDAENGNYIIIRGYDCKKILDQRIVWGQSNVDGNVEDYIRDLVNKAFVNPNLSARQIKNTQGRGNFFLGNKAGFNEVTSEQNSYINIGEKIREFCIKYNWGYKVIVDDTVKNFYFILYKGDDRSDYVVFSPDFENLVSSKYLDDSGNLANVALIAGEGEGSDRSRNVSGYAESLERNELYVDARDISRTITWESLTSMYPTTDQGGHGYIYITSPQQAITYKMDIIDIPIVDENQLTELQASYPNGQLITKNTVRYYQIYDVIIADLKSDNPAASDDVILRDLIYSVYLLNRGYEKLAEFGRVINFEGTVDPDTTFKYKTDYKLGDLVTVQNEFDIGATARIIEVIEVNDSNGYSVEPKFEYLEEPITPVQRTGYILTENNQILATENNEPLLLEKYQPLTKMSSAKMATSASELESKKISELAEVEALADGCCMPVVTFGETKKVTFETIKNQVKEEISEIEVIDNLTSTSSTAALSANQGKMLDENKVPNERTIAGMSLENDISIDDLAEALKIKILQSENPIGHIRMETTNKNPSTYLGFGTWVLWGSGKVPVGVNTTDTDFNTVEKTGGEKKHTLNINETPKHYHYLRYHGPTGNGVTISHDNYNSYDVLNINSWEWTKNSSKSNVYTDEIGGNQSHNNLQPYITCYMWKRTA